jgi:hypothetical protein
VHTALGCAAYPDDRLRWIAGQQGMQLTAAHALQFLHPQLVRFEGSGVGKLIAS